MYHLLPERKILTSSAFLIAFVTAYLAYWFEPSSSSLAILKYISATIFVVDIAVIVISAYLWRWLWKIAPILSDLVFPDLNGIWEGKIVFQSLIESNGLDAKARIRQTLWSIHIDLYSTTSESHTMVAYPTSEAGNHMVYYLFHNTPKNPDYPEYKGTSLLTIIRGKAPAQLSGHYYTIRGTKGRVELKRISDNPNGNLEM